MFTVITGGSGSGKSEFAESVVTQYGEKERFYIATMQPYDEESFEKIARHRRMRAEKQFTTIEAFTNLDQVRVPKGSVVLLDCMSNLVANEIFKEEKSKNKRTKNEMVKIIVEGIQTICLQCDHLIVVTNEVFSDGIQYDEWTMEYIQVLGTVNTRMATIAEKVIEVVYSIPIIQKGGSDFCE